MTFYQENYESIKYPKKESFRKGRIQELKDYLVNRKCDAESEEWVILEKIHGANSSFILYHEDGVDIWKFGRRNGIVPVKEMKSFFNIQEAYQPYVENLIELCKSACYEQGFDYRAHTTVIYSELYGKKVQKNTKYNDTESIAVFDIRIGNYFLSYEQRQELCDRHQLPTVPLIMSGTLDKLVEQFEVEKMFSHVPKLLHNSEIKEAPAEGVVLVPRYLDNIVDDPENPFLSYKWKKREFCERPIKVKPTDKEISLLEHLEIQSTGFLNQTTLEEYMSKVGVDYILNVKNKGTNIQALVQDAIESIKENGNYEALLNDKASWSRARRKLRDEAVSLIDVFIFEYIPTTSQDRDEKEYTYEEKEKDNECDILNEIDKSISDTEVNILNIRKLILEMKKRVSILES